MSQRLAAKTRIIFGVSSRSLYPRETFHAVDKRVAPGLVVKSVPEGAHVITFSNGTVAGEAFVSAEGTNGGSSMRSNKRLNTIRAAAQVCGDAEKRCRFVWTVDVLPDEMAGYINERMELAVGVTTPALEKA